MSSARDLAGALDRLAGALETPLVVEDRDALVAYVELVERWNARIDLTAAKGAEQLVEVLCADALMLRSDKLVRRDVRLVDVGSGAGAPAIPLMLLRPDLRAVLIEPLRKRTAFMRTVVGTLSSLTGRVEIRDAKIDLAAPAVDGPTFDVAMSRATFAPSEWLAAGRRLASEVIVLVARDEQGLPAAADAEIAYTLPRTGAHRSIRVYRA